MADEVDLDALLESALEDFDAEADPPAPRSVPPSQPREPTPLREAAGEPNLEELLKDPMKALGDLLSDPAMKAEFERDVGSMMAQFGATEGGEPFSLDKLQKELEKQMAEEESAPSPAPRSTSTTPSDPPSEEMDNLSATLQNLMNQAKDLQDPGTGNVDEQIMDMFKDMENNPELGSMMETLMEKFMSKEVLYEGLQEVQTKFKDWLAKKKQEGALSEEERVQYETQLDSIGKVLAIYEANEKNEASDVEMEQLMKQMELVGTLPEEVLSDISKPGELPGCSIM